MEAIQPSNRRNNRRFLGNTPNRRVEPTEIPEYVDNFNKIMIKFMQIKEETKNEFNQILIDNGCLIAGGSVLSASKPITADMIYTPINDFDIYLPIDKAITFLNQFTAFLFKTYNDINGDIRNIKHTSFNSSFYCNSFLKRNGIKKVHRFIVTSYPEGNSTYLTTICSFDIMILRKERNPIDVVNNFDLTFCQIWYDGKTIWASHPDDVRSKKGKLQGDYRKLFISGNPFIKNRVTKYVNKGYTIELDEFTGDEIKNSLIFNRELCPTSSPPYTSSWRDPKFRSKWAIRALKKSFLGDYYLSFIDFNLRYYDYHRLTPRRLYPFKSKMWDKYDHSQSIKKNTFKIKEDDGYDTDDYVRNDSLLVSLADQKYEIEEGAIELSTELTPQLKYHRMANIVLRDAIYPFTEDDTQPGYNFSALYYGRVDPFTGLARLIHGYTLNEVCSKYYHALSDYSLRIAPEDYLFASEGDRVYDMHNHPIEGAINQENLQAHLEANSEIDNKNQIPCYWKPEPGDSPKNCKQHLTLQQIFYCVDYKFFFKFRKVKGRENPSLSLNIPKYDQILYDTQEGPPQDPSWPNIFHHGVCPFCLESVSREAGCIYMTHSNPQRLPESEAPFCNPALVHKGIMKYYREEGSKSDPDYIPNIQDHLEFCIECGRPCFNHKHFMNEGNPERLLGGGGARVCVGGGRTELFARVLAIRKTFKDGGDRMDAAEAANEAPNDIVKLNEAARKYGIIKNTEGDRDWGNDLRITEGGKRSKRYGRTRKVRKP